MSADPSVRPRPLIHRGGADPLLVHLFTEGWCPVLAAALVSLDPDRFTLVETDEEKWHVAALDRNGRVWDIMGPRSTAEFWAEWGEFWPAFILDDEATAAAAAGDWFPVAVHLTANVFGEIDRNVWEVTRGIAGEILAVHDIDREAAA